MDKLQIAMLGRLPKEQVKEIIESLPEEERKELAKSPDLDLCGKVCYEVLAEDEDSDVRWSLSANSKIGNYPEVVEKLAKDIDEGVRWRLAKNPNIDKNTMLKLAKDKSNIVRMGVAGNVNLEKCGKECYEILESYNNIDIQNRLSKRNDYRRWSRKKLNKSLSFISGEYDES